MLRLESSGVERKFLEAQAWYEKNDYGEALKLFLELEAEDVKLAGVYFYLGLLYNFKFNDVERAGFYFKKALEMDPSFTPTYYTYASFLQNNNKFEELEKFLKKMEKKLPAAQADVYLEYAVMRESQFRYGEALKYYDLALKNAINIDFVHRIKDFRARCFVKWRKGTVMGKLESNPWLVSSLVVVGLLCWVYTLLSNSQ